ncbi:enoyl-CoA hydratase/isomerase family protein [Embleya scabrispora]|uniref:enoyl-CoA hydratase/isomerase family protein n=1 Tax=Embleya scabrispora TaxID=159449 RepID=UPI000375132E|nr:enoyl-CoA hydratase-related protein [Embleya scabrispora]MYS84273.1 crotonase [Streptomyces sp. SID5474]
MIRFAIHDGVAVVTLDRPDRLNVFSGGMGLALGDAYARCDADDAVRVVVLTGAGRAFCAGADMSPAADTFAGPGPASRPGPEPASEPASEPRARAFSASPVQPPAWAVRKPVIAAINGHAIGIGFTLAMQCDIRIVAEDAKLAIPQVRRGMVPDAQSHWTVPAATSRAVAADILLTGRTFRGSEALALGLASRALPAAEVLPAALEIAHDIATNVHPVSAALTKRLLWADAGPDEVERLETAYHRILMGTDDAREGPRAWSERRAPRWTGTVTGAWDRVREAESAESSVQENK